MQFAADIYRFSQHVPHTEQYGLTSQIRRATTSIAKKIDQYSDTRSIRELELQYDSQGADTDD